MQTFGTFAYEDPTPRHVDGRSPCISQEYDLNQRGCLMDLPSDGDGPSQVRSDHNDRGFIARDDTLCQMLDSLVRLHEDV